MAVKIHTYVGHSLRNKFRGTATLGRTFTYPYVATGSFGPLAGGHAPFLVTVRIREVPRLGKVWIGIIPCIKTSNNIIEVNNGIESISCYVREDREAMTLDLTPENDPFFYQDNEKRIFGNIMVTIRI